MRQLRGGHATPLATAAYTEISGTKPTSATAVMMEPVSGIEPLTCRLQEGRLPSEPSRTANCASPVLPAYWLARANESILASVPPCAGECRIVCGYLVGATPDDPDLWGFCGGADRADQGVPRSQAARLRRSPGVRAPGQSSAALSAAGGGSVASRTVSAISAVRRNTQAESGTRCDAKRCVSDADRRDTRVIISAFWIKKTCDDHPCI